MDKGKPSAELICANQEVESLKEEKAKLSEELALAHKALAFQNEEMGKRSDELAVANKELAFQGPENEKRATEHILLEDQFRKSVNQFQLMVRTIKSHCIIMLDAQGRVATWNVGAELINGYTKEEIIGKSHEVFYTLREIEDGEPQRKLQMALLQGHLEWEGFRLRKDGSQFYANTVLTPIFDKTGEISGYSRITKDISEQKKAEHDLKELNIELEQRVLDRTEKLARSEAFNVDVLNSLTSHIAVLDQHGNVIAVNDSWSRFARENGDVTLQSTGVGSNYLAACKKAETENVDEANAVIRGIQDVMAEKIAHFSLEYACHLPTKQRWFSMRVVKFKNKEPMVVISHQNITNRKEAEQKLIKSNRLYAFISAINQSIVHINDEQELLEKACDIAVTIGGYKTSWIALLDEKEKLNVVSIKGDEAMANEVLKFSGKDYTRPPFNTSSTGEVMRTGKYVMKNVVQEDPVMKPYKNIFVEHGIKATISFSIKKFSKTVGVFAFYSTKEAFFDEQEVALLEEASNDISFALENFEKERQRKIAEDKILATSIDLKHALNEINAIMDSSLDVICAVDPDGHILKVSAASEAVWGYKPKELIGKRIFDFIYHEDLLKTIDSAEGVMQGRNLRHFENRYVHKNGSLVPMSWTATWDARARIRYGVGRDITQQKDIEKMKEKITSDIVQRNIVLEQFSYMVSHNLRAPVANIIGLTEVLQNPRIIDGNNKQLLEDLAASAGRLDTVIKDLNYILQIKREVTEKKERVLFSELVNDIKISISHTIKKEQVVIQTDFSNIDTIFTLKSYLYSIFYNLITNSIKYRQPGMTAHVEITSFASKNKMTLIFKDNGLGINLKKRGDQVFGLYKRFHTHVDGKGMGLYMVKAQVETLGGCISIQSEENKGTEFKIEFEIE